MRGVYSVDQIRTAEDALLARLPEGVLMQRAAYGLAQECLGLLGSAYGARVVLLVGAGNNGGDALYAGAYLARRGVHVTAVLLLDRERAHAGGLEALEHAHGQVRDAAMSAQVADCSPAPTSSWTASSGSVARAGCARTRYRSCRRPAAR